MKPHFFQYAKRSAFHYYVKFIIFLPVYCMTPAAFFNSNGKNVPKWCAEKSFKNRFHIHRNAENEKMQFAFCTISVYQYYEFNTTRSRF